MGFFWRFAHPCDETWQLSDSDDEVEGFAGSDDSQPMTDRLDADGVSTYGEDCLVPEPHKVRADVLTVNNNNRVDVLAVWFYLHVIISVCLSRI